jgi:hypothetical protein
VLQLRAYIYHINIIMPAVTSENKITHMQWHICPLGKRGDLHRGQVTWPNSTHLSMHPLWNKWEQFPNFLTSCLASSSAKQTTQTASSPFLNSLCKVENLATWSLFLMVEASGSGGDENRWWIGSSFGWYCNNPMWSRETKMHCWRQSRSSMTSTRGLGRITP